MHNMRQKQRTEFPTESICIVFTTKSPEIVAELITDDLCLSYPNPIQNQGEHMFLCINLRISRER